ncbi:hypothetical protein PIROE2DRAFT_70021 [Piromyces sp. E2]|nr:hypothetical protein PIROE2DRAFT_70021 [Piromyces sp. E2]|eukprot:OUM57849.1 hypothetical protein PIROE2DRAFT_70021 [Piromyces sp. E2]
MIKPLYVIVKLTARRLKKINFKDIFPYDDVVSLLPQLKIGEDGYPTYNVEEILAGFDTNPENYENLQMNNFSYLFFQSNKDFDINNIMMTIQTLKVSEKYDNEFIENLFLNIEEENITGEEDIFDIDIIDFKSKNATMIFEFNGNEYYSSELPMEIPTEFPDEPQRPIEIINNTSLQFLLETTIESPTETPISTSISTQSELPIETQILTSIATQTESPIETQIIIPTITQTKSSIETTQSSDDIDSSDDEIADEISVSVGIDDESDSDEEDETEHITADAIAPTKVIKTITKTKTMINSTF